MQNLNAAVRSARQIARAALDQQADIFGVEAIDVLPRIHRLEDALLVDVCRQWNLHQDAVYLRVGVQRVDDSQELGLGRLRRQDPVEPTRR